MIDNNELLAAILGQDKVETFKEVKLASMRLARVVKEVIADELGAQMPSTGKQFLKTKHGLFRLAARSNSDNTTEQLANRRLGAKTVQVFGDLTPDRRAKGWLTIEDLYALHGVQFRSQRMLRKVVARFRSSGRA